MNSDFIYNIDIEIKGISVSEKSLILTNIGNLEINPNITQIILEVLEFDKRGNIRIYLEDYKNEDDYNSDFEVFIDYLEEEFLECIETGSKIELINRNTITSLSWCMGNDGWETYQKIDRDLGLGDFDDFDDDY
jgi:hypothetical protein